VPLKSPYFTSDHEEFRASVRRYVEKEITPHVATWEEQGGFPREIFRELGGMGYLGINFPESVGGADLDFFTSVAMLEELARCGAGGFCGAVAVQAYMATPPLQKLATDACRDKYLIPAIAGDKIGALAITEPDCGSDVAALRTRGVRHGDHFLVSGAKTFITNGCVADFLTCAVRTTDAAGHRGISLLVIDTSAKGCRVSKRLKKLGWHSSDTAGFTFDDCIVPVENLLGEEGRGFQYVMDNFRIERLVAAVMSVASSQWIFDEALRYARTRKAFNRPIAEFQVLRHRFADMETEIEAARQLTYHAAWLYAQGESAVREITMAKLHCAELAPRVADRCLQVFGGYGYMEEYPAARAFRDSRLLPIGGGSSEIMREILSGILLDGRPH
jgi:alkylation response protein AidB-like acyl-CoA dehydrogenase